MFPAVQCCFDPKLARTVVMHKVAVVMQRKGVAMNTGVSTAASRWQSPAMAW